MSRKEPNRNVYVGHRYVPLILEEWNNKISYEGLSVVTHQGGSYTSKKRVPVGIDILNKEFWSLTGNYNAQVEYYRDETERVSNKLDSKSDITYVDTELGKKSDKSYVDTELGKKSDKSYVDTELGKKSDITYVDTELDKKSDITYVDTELDKKSDITYVDDEITDLKELIKEYGLNVTMSPINLITDGVSDDTAKLQQAVNLLQDLGGGKLIIPEQDNPYTIIANNPTIENPKMVRITGDNIHIEGVGSPTINMKGIDKAYMDSVDDLNSSGRDIFTGFSFFLTENCSVRNLRFKGTYDGKGVFRYDSPRAKGIGFIGVKNCWAENITGENLLGNVINGTPADGGHDGIYRPLEKLKISNCFAYNNMENGFNFMGNTHDCVIEKCTSYNNSSCGIEAGGTNLKMVNNDCRHNKIAGMASSGDGVIISGNTISENDSQDGNIIAVGLQLGSTGTNIIVSNNRIERNEGFGINFYPGHKTALVTNNIFVNNHLDTTRSHSNNIIGTTEKKIYDLTFTGNTFENDLEHIERVTTIGGNIGTKIHGNTVRGKGTPFSVMSNCENIDVFNNILENPPVVSQTAINSKAFNNVGIDGTIFYAVGRPYIGTYKKGDYVYNLNPAILGAEGSEHIIKGWSRITDGSEHVNKVDWIDDKVYL